MSERLSDSLAQSQQNRRAMLSRFGFIPFSILKIARGALSKRMFLYQHENPVRHVGKSEAVKDKSNRLLEAGYDKKSFASGTKAGRGTLGVSIMPAELVDFFVKYYAHPGAVYLDPFMGQGIRMQVAKLRGLHYYGYDLSTEFFRYVDAVRLRIDDGSTTLSITHGDSRYPVNVPDAIGDFGFTSPPYYNIEDYGDEPGQLGKLGTYDDFLDGMREVAAAWLAKFKQGAYYVVNVNDFKMDGHFIPYHSDTIVLHRQAGWVLTDTWIIDGLVGGIQRAFAVRSNMSRIAPKVHEYALVFRKP